MSDTFARTSAPPITSPMLASLLDSPLLVTKLRVPPLRQRALDRQHLCLPLWDDPALRLCLLTAPPGYGKTTLLVQWVGSLQRSGVTVAWYTLDSGDNDPARFGAYLLSTMSRALGSPPGLKQALGMLRSQPQVSLEHLLGLVVNELAETDSRLVLALDDYHLIESPSIHAGLAHLIDHLPVNARVIVASRSEPPLPLARLLARGQLAQLRATDLRFSPEESAAFLTQVMDLQLDTAEATHLASRTEGWAAGLQLAAMSLRRQPGALRFAEGLDGANRHVLRYLAAEALDTLPEEARVFLLRTSILDHLSGPLCDAVTALTDSQKRLEVLESANVFTMALDEEGRWFRYHALFRDFLHGQLIQVEPPEVIAELHRRAASWYRESGEAGEAVRHALAAPDLELAARIVEEVGDGLWRRGELSSLLSLLHLLPADLLSSRPRLVLLHAVALVLSGQGSRIATIDEHLAAIETRLRQEDGTSEVAELLGMSYAVRSTIAAMRRDDGEGPLSLAGRALDLLPAANALWRGLAAVGIANACFVRGDVQPALDAYAAALAANQAADNPGLALWAGILRAICLRRASRLGDARDAGRWALDRARAIGPGEEQAARSAHLTLGWIHYEWDELEAAARHLDRAVELAELCQDASTLWQALSALAELRQARGDASGARTAVSEAVQVARERTLWPGPLADAEATMALLSLRQGRVAEAADWAKGIRASDSHVYRHELQYLVAARVRVAIGDLSAALDLLSLVTRASEAAERIDSLIHALVVEALVHFARRDQRAAITSLARALALGRGPGYRRAFLDEGARMGELLRLTLQHELWRGKPELPYVHELLSRLERRDAAAHAQSLPEPLSERELEILGLLALGASNADIAGRLVITVGTVKTHTNHIFAKLAVRNRTEAVARARELRLIPL